ncbi:MAG TPA: hypothetical protein ENH03_02465 [Candidatus Bathyarchaeota archaeon]|nr:hypothetical protein [Candidatus Bathyarchaeota archaeon]HDO41745.1 hypothetical protein [Candidatus Bathyarchaeota archaeon]
MRNDEIAGYVMLFVGLALLIVTFFFAYTFLYSDVGEMVPSDIVQAFGRSLAPLVSACIHAIFLGIMGWIGSILTARGVALLKRTL